MGIRESINERPWLGWAIAGILLVLGVLGFFWRMGPGGDAYDPQRMTQVVTIKYTDTGDTEEIPRGRLIKRMLDENKGVFDPKKGLQNPKTKEYTGFLYNKSEWEALIKQLNEDREDASKQKPSPPPPPPRRGG